MRYLFWFGTLLVAVVCAIFAVSNRQLVEVALWPFAGSALLPLYVLALGTAAIGLLAGLLAGWVRSFPLRLERRRLNQRLAAVEAELGRVKARVAEPSIAPISVPVRVDA